MQGSLSIGDNLNKWTADDIALSTKMIASYKEVRETVQHGNLYCLISGADNNPEYVTESVSRDRKRAVLFAYLHSSSLRYPFPRVFLQGLDPKAMYSMLSIYGTASKEIPTTASGDYWMHRGVHIMMKGDFEASAFILEAK